MIAYPIYLRLILNRIDKCFYNTLQVFINQFHFKGVVEDVLLIRDNAMKFNKPNSKLYRLAKKVLTQLSDRVQGFHLIQMHRNLSYSEYY